MFGVQWDYFRMISHAFVLILALAGLVFSAPQPNNNWATLPVAYHGGNLTGEWTDAAIAQLAKYQMVTVEKWHTPCGGKHPVMNGPCNEESAIENALRRLRAVNEDMILVAYFNSVIDFSFYNFAGELEAMEKKGTEVWMRDVNGKVVSLDNDGSFYYDINRYNVSEPAMMNVWLDAVHSLMTAGGGYANGGFFDHGNKFLEKNSKGVYQLCDGKGDRFRCVEFSDAQAAQWNAAHVHQLAQAQSMVDPFPAYDSVNSTWTVDACNYREHKEAVAQNKWIEAQPRNFDCATEIRDDCLAAFLAAAGPKSFYLCLSSQYAPTDPLPTWFPEFDKPLGAPKGPAVPRKDDKDVLDRAFASGTTVTFNTRTNTGTINWAT